MPFSVYGVGGRRGGLLIYCWPPSKCLTTFPLCCSLLLPTPIKQKNKTLCYFFSPLLSFLWIPLLVAAQAAEDVLLRHKSRSFTALTSVALQLQEDLRNVSAIWHRGSAWTANTSVWLLVYFSTGKVFVCSGCFFFLYSLRTADGRSSWGVVNSAGRAGRASVGSLIACVLSQGSIVLPPHPYCLQTQSPVSLCHWWLCSVNNRVLLLMWCLPGEVWCFLDCCPSVWEFPHRARKGNCFDISITFLQIMAWN